ncbi:uncharacterized protein HKW66_Vig0216470 [Vigna angularis]|uniref:AT-hook motif nuclear-localized protein n=1 Tax=Phaseolus angularis TaxID=3914 RepID=A0A8T0JHM8_PHAAN|nr:uncharacterized protein HKW66_Vig0216470 [Vigna angularis]
MKKRGRPPGSKSNRGRGRSPSPSPSGFRGSSPSPSPSGFRACSPSPGPSGVPPNTVSNVELFFDDIVKKFNKEVKSCVLVTSFSDLVFWSVIFQNLICLVVDMQTETGTDLVAYQITVNIGEDLVDKVSRIAKRSSQTVCILSAVGSISSVVFRKPGLPSTDTVTWELTLGTFKLGSAGKTTIPACATAPTTSGPLLIPKTEYQELESLTTPKTADKTSECDITPKTADKTSESVTTPKETDKPTENVTSTSRDGEDPNGEGEKQSVTPKITDKPQEELSSETVDKPPENVTPSTSDKPPEDVTPATSDKPPEDVTPATSDKPPEDVTPATSDIPS